MNKYFKFIVFVFVFQACAFISNLSDKPETETRLEPIIEETGKPSDKPSPESKDKPKQVEKKPAEKVPDKKTSIALIEELMLKGEWTEVRRVVNEWKIKGPKVKRELKSHIGLVRGFMTGYDRCNRLEDLSSEPRREVVACYVKLLKHNWNNLPKKSYFSREFAAHLDGRKNNVLKKMKRLRLGQDLEVIEEDIRQKAILGKEIIKSKRTTPQEFLDAYYSCFKLERTSPNAVTNILNCYREAYITSRKIPPRVTYPQELSMEVYTKGKEVEDKIDLYHRKFKQMKEKEKTEGKE